MNERLGIQVPLLQLEWEEYSDATQHEIVSIWENIRGRIPSRVYEFEQIIIYKQNELYEEDNFARSCELNWEIAEFASRINDLHLWYRMNQDVRGRSHF